MLTLPVKMRYEASIRPGYQESFGAMFPAPRQRSVDAMACTAAADALDATGTGPHRT